jgi:DNA helicase II / ATP-dependent DNA helicase PcrA
LPDPTVTRLTGQQRAIVQHTTGPALVFAVAGAGKTTAMVHRIERLVREQIFPAESILATSFGRLAVDDIKEALARWPHCWHVRTRTLHSLGNDIVRRAADRGLMGKLQLVTPERLLGATLARARRGWVEHRNELDGFDEEDFLTYVGVCKGNLQFADLAAARLPARGAEAASQAVAPPGFPWYLKLYRAFEEARREQSWLTYDDQILIAWQLLVTHADLLRDVRYPYKCVLVDEFQDVNLAKSEILDLLTAPHRNYMAIGDDDQTVYEWRGAHPRFILGFEGRYRARTYLIDDCFRCPAPQLALANRVIERNRQRRPKQLNLTRGFEGTARVEFADSAGALGREVARAAATALRTGAAPSEVAVLVRLYAQTPHIEQSLIANGIPYRVIGNKPFFQRPEVVTLLNYCRLAMMDLAVRAGRKLTLEQKEALPELLKDVVNRPKRYIANRVVDAASQAVVKHGVSLAEALNRASRLVDNGSVADRVMALGRDIEWLGEAIGRWSASEVLGDLDRRLKYSESLRRGSAINQAGEGKAATVAALIDYARGKGTMEEFLVHLRHLEASVPEDDEETSRDAVSLLTIFRAKGLEWPVVLVPDCNQGTIPFGEPERLEEERRLLHVAITRSKRELRLFCRRDVPISPFLRQAAHEDTLTAVATVGALLTRDPASWAADEALALAAHATSLRLGRYLTEWWAAAPDRKVAVARTMGRFFAAVEHHHLAERLGIRAEQAALWRAIAPELPIEAGSNGRAGDFPGIEALLARSSPPPTPASGGGAPPPARTRAEVERQYQVGKTVRHAQHGRGRVVKVEHGRIADALVATVVFESTGTKELRVRFSDPAPAPSRVVPSYRVGDRVQHATFGRGRVIGIDTAQPERPIVTIDFEAVGTKKLSARDAPLTPLDPR